MKTKFNKIISMLLIFCMIFTLLPIYPTDVYGAVNKDVTQIIKGDGGGKEGNNGETGDTGMQRPWNKRKGEPKWLKK